jgi:hypothetical protein
MSGEDIISKLFKDSESNLDETPRQELWDRLELKLDNIQSSEKNSEQDLSATGTRTKVINLKYLLYLSAASILLILTATLYFIQNPENNKTISENIKLSSEERIEESETLPVVEAESEARFEKNDKIQEKKIIEEYKNLFNISEVETEKELDIESISMVEATDDVQMIIPEILTKEEDKSVLSVPKSSGLYSNDFENTGNYSNAPSIVSRSEYIDNGKNFSNPPVIENVLSNKVISAEKKNSSIPKVKAESSSIPSIKKSKKEPYSNKLNSRLSIFEWLLGSWIDREEEGSKTYENWTVQDKNSIVISGFKISGSTKIFEEKMTIYFDEKTSKIYLIMPLDERNQNVTYTLLSYDNESIVFYQNTNSNFPDKVIIERKLSGFTTTVLFSQGFFNTSQQTYLDNRNRVSNRKALRTLEPVNK